MLGFAAYSLRLPLPTPGHITAIVMQTNYVATTLRDGRILFTPYPNYAQQVYDYQPWLTVLWAWWYGHVMPWPKYGVEPPAMISAVLFDAKTRKFSYTSAMNEPGEYDASVVLQDGRVFLNETGSFVRSPGRAPELYDPRSGKFENLASTYGSRMLVGLPVLLKSGELLIVSGEDPPILWDPGTNRIKELGVTIKEWRPTKAVTLDNGKILFIGTECLINRQVPTLELYDPDTEQFSFAGSFPEQFNPCSPIKLREGGRVFILDCEGSMNEHFNTSTLPTRSYAEIYGPGIGRLERTSLMTTLRLSPLSILLKDGRVLLVRGLGFANDVRNWRLYPLDSAEIYDPDSNEFEAVGRLPQSMSEHREKMGESLMLLPDGRVLYTAPGIERNAALYDPFSRTFSAMCVTDLASGFRFQLDDGNVLLVGSPTAAIAEPFNWHNGSFQVFVTGIGRPATHWMPTIRRFVTGYPADQIKRDQFLK